MVEVGLIDVEVHHTGVRTADLGDVGVAETTADLSGLAPVFDLRFDFGVSPFDDTGDDGMSLAGTFEVSDHFADSAAGIEFAEPGRDVGVGIVRSGFLLDVDEDDRDIEVSDGRQHVVGCCVGQELQDDEVDVRCAELVAGGHGLFFGGDDAAVDDFDGVRKVLFLERFVLSVKFRDQSRELGQVRAKSDGEDADACFGFYEAFDEHVGFLLLCFKIIFSIIDAEVLGKFFQFGILNGVDFRQVGDLHVDHRCLLNGLDQTEGLI